MSTNANPWLYACLASSLPDITPKTDDSKQTRIRTPGVADDGFSDLPPPCKILQQFSDSLTEQSQDSAQNTIGLEPQVLIFRYRSKIHAIDHACPHQTYPLSRGSIYDIEDFGIVLSAGISCPKHGWAFDLFTGESDRGRYRLGLWEVEERDAAGLPGEEKEVWVRKKEGRKRIG